MPALALGIAVFFSLYSATSTTFPTLENARSMLGTQSVLGIAALGALMPLVLGAWDLSVGATLGLSAVMSASAMSSGASIPVAILVAVGIGMAIGAVNGLLVVRARVNAVIATLGTATVIDGVVQMKTKGITVVSNLPAGLSSFGTDNIVGIPRIFLVPVVVAGVAYFVLEHTPFGRYLYAMGSNPTASRLVGLRTDRLMFLSFVAGGSLAGAAGILQVARAGAADPHVGAAFTLPALAAAFLSAAAIKPGRFNVGGVLVAILFLAVLNSGLNLAGAAPYVSSYVNGVALIVGVAFASWMARRQGKTVAMV